MTIRRLIGLLTLIAALGLVMGAPVKASADGGGEPTRLVLAVPERASLGETVRVEATLTTEEGDPVPGAVVEFSSPLSWGVWGALEEAHGGAGGEEDGHTEAVGGGHGEAEMASADAAEEEGHGEGEDSGAKLELGSAVTDAGGLAAILYEIRREGDLEIAARFDGSEGYGSSSSEGSLTIAGVAQLYTPSVGIRVPLIGAWFLAAILAAVWGSYFVVGLLVYGIAAPRPAEAMPTAEEASRVGGGLSRRDFLQQAAVPLGMMAFVGSVGSGIMTIIARNPNTHNNLKSSRELKRYSRTPFAPVGLEGGTKPLPPILEREVSFSREVLPILLERAGPHAMPPKNSPPPGGVLLDSYEHIMARDGLVVPGKPEESELVSVLRSEVMYMPPVRTAPLSEEQVQLIASWVAQGAGKT